MAKQSSVRSKRKIVNPVFHLQTKKEDDNQLTKGLIKIVRRTGQLNLSGRSLANVPDSMFTMYDLTDDDRNISLDFDEPKDESWWNFQPLTYLDLSSNVLQELPGKIGIFEDLTTLNLQDNNLKTLPSNICKLTRLTKLNVSHNKLQELPVEFFDLVELQTLNLSHNQLTSIPREFGNLVMLLQLDLSHNCLVDIAPGLGYLVRLTEIDLSHNKLTELPPDIVNMRGLLKIDVTHNELIALPDLGEIRKLQLVYAQHNNIEKLPGFEGCQNVHELYFGNNFIKEIPIDFCENMPNLKILELRDNKIEELPNEIAMLQHLIRLDITNNDLSSLPNSLGLLSHLQNLQVEGNKLKQIRPDIIKGGTLRILKHLREKFEGEEFENLPKSPRPVFEPKTFPDKYVMRNTRSLVVIQKQLTTVPDDVFESAKFGEVTVVDLGKNKLTQVPPGLEMLKEDLGELNLSQNLISECPEFLGEFRRLKYLDLGNNHLSSLPDCLGCLEYLRELVLNNNRFTNIPSCVYNMVGLEILLVSDNKLTEIDVENLGKLTRLAVLDLRNNNINHVPPQLGNLKQLRTLELIGNPFKQPRYAILEQGTESIMSYLRDRIPQ